MLVIFITRRKCTLHDLMVDYLRQLHNDSEGLEDYWKFLNQSLVQSYLQKCQENPLNYPDDGYFYQYYVYHCIQAEDNAMLEQLMTDFNWMTSKLKFFQSISYFYNDQQDYINYLNRTQQVKISSSMDS